MADEQRDPADDTGSGGSTGDATGGVVVGESAVDVLRKCGGKLPRGTRVYSVECHGPHAYAIANSPGNAALAVTNVQRLTDREIMQAALEAMGVK